MCENEKGNGQANPETSEVEAAEVEAAEVEAAEVEAADPLDHVKKLDPLEIERFLRFDLQAKVLAQGLRIIEFELLELKRNFQAKTDERNQRKAVLQNEIKTVLTPQYQDFIQSLADKYEISEPTAMLIDPDLGTIRDSREV